MGIVVVGVDGSEQSLGALSRALAEGERRGADVHVVHVSDVSPAVLHLPGQITVNTTDLAEAARRDVWEKCAPLTDNAPDGTELVDIDGYPADAIVDYCESNDAELLVLGTRGRGRIAKTLLGSTSMRALEQAKCDVLIVKPKGT